MAKDILLDQSGDLACVNGDFVFGESYNQHIGLLLKTNKGEWKENPTAGIGLDDMINDDGVTSELGSTIKKNLMKDGCNVKAISFDENTGKLHIEGSYE